MTQTQIQELAKLLSQYTAHDQWLYYVLAAVLIGACSFLGTYLAEKAKNTATKEDIGTITRKIEEARSEYSAKIEELKGTYQLRAVSLEKRLAILQEAFVMWDKLILSTHENSARETARECSDWWTKNCVYLPSSVRDAFINAVNAAYMHRALLEGQRDPAELDANWSQIRNVPDVIMKAANLPPLPSEVLSEIRKR
jgi:hypothetical protein